MLVCYQNIILFTALILFILFYIKLIIIDIIYVIQHHVLYTRITAYLLLNFTRDSVTEETNKFLKNNNNNKKQKQNKQTNKKNKQNKQTNKKQQQKNKKKKKKKKKKNKKTRTCFAVLNAAAWAKMLASVFCPGSLYLMTSANRNREQGQNTRELGALQKAAPLLSIPVPVNSIDHSKAEVGMFFFRKHFTGSGMSFLNIIWCVFSVYSV